MSEMYTENFNFEAAIEKMLDNKSSIEVEDNDSE